MSFFFKLNKETLEKRVWAFYLSLKCNKFCWSKLTLSTIYAELGTILNTIFISHILKIINKSCRIDKFIFTKF